MAAKKRYSIIDKMRIIWKLRDQSIQELSAENDVPIRTIRKWEKNYEQIKAEYYKYLHDEGVHKLMVAQNRFADKIGNLTEAITPDKIKAAPLNQVVSAIGILVDRFLRIHDAKDIQETPDEHRYSIEYYDANTGKVSAAPPWTEDDSLDDAALHSSYLWQTLWENRIGEAGHHGDGGTGQDDLVARTYLSDGESGLAGFESDDAERDWYPD